MGVIRNIIESIKAARRAPTESDHRYVASTVRTGEENAGRVDTIDQRNMLRVGRASVGSVANACTLIARECAKGELCLYRKPRGRVMDEDEAEEVTSHPILDLLRDPDPSTTLTDLLTLIFWYREACGVAYIWTGGKKPTGLYVLPPQYTRPVLDRTNGVKGYQYGREQMQPAYFPMEEVVVSRWQVDPLNPMASLSWSDSVAHFADIESAAVTAEIARWKNSGQPGIVVRVPIGYNKAQMEQAEAALRGKGGPLAAGRALILRGDVEITQSASKPHEMNYLPGMQHAAESIYRAAGIPDSVWKMNDAIQSNAREGNIAWQRVVYGRQCAFARDLTEWLIPMFGEDPQSMWFAYENPVEEDKTAEASRINAGFTAGVVRVNEYREALGLEPVGEEEDTLGRAPIQLTAMDPAADTATDTPAAPVPDAAPVADVAATALNGAQVQALADLAMQVAQGQLPLASARALATAAFPMVPTEILDAVFNPLDTFTPETPDAQGTTAPETPRGAAAGSDEPGADPAGGTPPESKSRGNDPERSGKGGAPADEVQVSPQLIPRWGTFGCACGHSHKMASTTDDAIEQRIFRAVQSWAEDALKRGISAIGEDGAFDISALSSAELEKVLNAAITSAFEAGAVSMNIEVGADGPPLTSDAARQYIADYNFDLVKGVTETMADQMRTSIDAGLESGQTINQIQQELTDKVPEVSLARAELIAKTETARAYQHGAIRQAEDLGFEYKEWNLSGNPCGLCEGAARALEGKQTKIGEPFFAAGTTIAGTDGKTYTTSMPIKAACEIHPSCYCGTVTVTEAL